MTCLSICIILLKHFRSHESILIFDQSVRFIWRKSYFAIDIASSFDPKMPLTYAKQTAGNGC